MPFAVLDPASAAAAPTTTIGAPKTATGETLASMRTWLLDALAGRDDATPTKLNGWINDSYIDLATSLEFDELRGSLGLSTVSGSYLYKLPYIVSSIQGISLIDTTLPDGGQTLTQIDNFAFRDLRSVDNARPYHYFRENDLLVLYPTPNKAYVMALDIRIRPTPLVNDTDSPILGQEWHRAIRLGARQKAYDDLAEFDKSLVAENSYTNTVRRRTDREAEEDEGRVPRSSVPGRIPSWAPGSPYSNRDWRR